MSVKAVLGVIAINLILLIVDLDHVVQEFIMIGLVKLDEH